MIGRTLGHYRVVEKLGEGGMGVVYKAQDLHLDRLVALKVLPPDKLTDPDPSTGSGSARATSRAERRQRFTQEAKAASALNHPHIITIHDIASDGGIDFIAMEYVAGRTLGELIPRKGLRLNEALKIAVQMADALAKAHAAGIIHRDLKPGNVMVTKDGQVKVLDFGLAKLTEAVSPAGDEPTHTAKPTTDEGAIVGTVAYMSPEQAQGKKVDARSDIFSFGAVLYEVVTGCRAFQGDTRASTLAAVLKDEPKPASQIAVGLPKEMDRLIRRCLHKDPAHRVQHMDDLKVALEELKEESDSGALAAVTAPTKPRRWRGWVLVGIAGTLVLAALTVWLRPAAPPASDLKAVPLTSYAGVESEPSFSPDGSKVAFTWSGEKGDNDDIYVMQIGSTGMPVRLTTSPMKDQSPAWSPDDRRIAFERVQQGTVAIVLIPSIGGPEFNLTELPGLSSQLSWAPNGKWLAVNLRDPATGRLNLWLVSAETGERRPLTTFTTGWVGGLRDLEPAFSPDGRSLAFARQTASFLYELHVLRLTKDYQPDGEPLRITDRRYPTVDGVAWTADGREIVYGAGGAQTQSLWRVPVSGRQAPRLLPFALPAASYPAIARTSPRLIYRWWLFNRNLWRLDTRTGERTKLTRSTYDDAIPQYSRDGSRIAFQSNRSGNLEIWTCHEDGSDCQQITRFGGPQSGTPHWSPDGHRIAFDSRVEGRSEIFIIAADGGAPRRLTTTPGFNNMIPSWSADGQWLYFASNRSGRDEIWKVPAEGGTEIQVTRAGGVNALSSPDGKYLYYVKRAPSKLYRMPAEGGEETVVVGDPLGFAEFGVTAKGVYFVSDSDLRFLDATTGKIKSRGLVAESGGMCVSPDGRYVVWSQVDQNTADLMLVENFR
jgi:eukaryotic-like serine/threonine-protein kinase